MEVVAHLRNLRISARKVRLVADVIRGMNIHDARIQLEFLHKKSSEPVLTLMNSAVANAQHNFDLSDKNLYVAKIFVNEGATLKRWIPRAMGRASAINKRTSHITIILDEKKDKKMKNEKKDITKIKEVEKKPEAKTETQSKKTETKKEIKQEKEQIENKKTAKTA